VLWSGCAEVVGVVSSRHRGGTVWPMLWGGLSPFIHCTSWRRVRSADSRWRHREASLHCKGWWFAAAVECCLLSSSSLRLPVSSV